MSILQQILGFVWRVIPVWARRTVVRRTQTHFTASVGAVVINDAGQVLLLDHVLRPGSGWGIPGGFMEENEQPETTAKRELCEEVGLEIAELQHFSTQTSGRHIEVIYSCLATNQPRVKSNEILEAKWFPPDALPPEVPKSQGKIISRVLADRENNRN